MKDHHTDLPLFRCRVVDCKIYVFPLSRRIGKIRHVVEVYNRGKSQKWRDQYIDRIHSDLKRELAVKGISETDIAIELELFGRELNAEFNRIKARQG